MDPAILDQGLERPAGDLAADRIEAGDDHGVWGVVDDDVHARGRLEGADVPPLAPDDAPLHLVVGQRHGGDGALRGVFRGKALGGDGDDPAGVAVGALLGLLLDVADQRRRLAPGFVLDPLEDLAAGILRGEPGDPLQPVSLLLGHAVGLALAGPERQLLLAQRLLPFVEVPLARVHLLDLAVLAPGALFRPLLHPLPLVALALDLAVEILPQLERFHLGCEHDLRLGRLRLACDLPAELERVTLRRGEHAAGRVPLAPSVQEDVDESYGQTRGYPRERGDEKGLEHREGIPTTRPRACRVWPAGGGGPAGPPAR
jgi:hypothetical protein